MEELKYEDLKPEHEREHLYKIDELTWDVETGETVTTIETTPDLKEAIQSFNEWCRDEPRSRFQLVRETILAERKEG